MNKFLNNPVINILRTRFKIKPDIDFMKHKLVFLSVPLLILLSLVSFFAYNMFNKKYDVDSLFENSKTIIQVPVKSDVDSYTLNKIQNIATNLLNCKCSAQKSEKYLGFVNESIGKIEARGIILSANKSLNLTTQQKNMLFNELKMHFPKLIETETNEAEDIISSVNYQSAQKNDDFWQQLALAASILTVLMLLHFGLKFKKLGFFSVTTVALSNFIFSAGTMLMFLVILTKKINLTFMIAMSFYFTTNLISLFHKIKKQVPDLKKINKAKAAEIANNAILETIPNAIFVGSSLIVALLCSVVLWLIFDNRILFYFTLSAAIGILLDVFFNLFCSGPLWVMLKRKEFKPKSLKKA